MSEKLYFLKEDGKVKAYAHAGARADKLFFDFAKEKNLPDGSTGGRRFAGRQYSRITLPSDLVEKFKSDMKEEGFESVECDSVSDIGK